MHKPLPVTGYKPQSQHKVDLVNRNKELEETILRILDDLAADPVVPGNRGTWEPLGVDQRWLAIARTNLEQGFMAMNRAIFAPGRVKLENDE